LARRVICCATAIASSAIAVFTTATNAELPKSEFQDHIGNETSVPVYIHRADRDNLSEHEIAGEPLCLGSERLAGLRAVDPIQADTLRAAVVKDRNRVPVRDETTFALKLCAMAGAARRKSRSASKQRPADLRKITLNDSRRAPAYPGGIREEAARTREQQTEGPG
jgi:hypothetical protein